MLAALVALGILMHQWRNAAYLFALFVLPCGFTAAIFLTSAMGWLLVVRRLYED
jgi:hypothetical protein